MPGLGLLHALPLLDGDSFGRGAFEHGAVARGKQLAAFFLDQRLRLRRVLLHVRVVVADIDLGDRVDWRLRLRVQRVNGNASEPEACDDGQRDAGTSLHSFPFAVWCCGLSRRVLPQEKRRAIIVPTDSQINPRGPGDVSWNALCDASSLDAALHRSLVLNDCFTP